MPACVDCGGAVAMHEPDCICYYCVRLKIPYDLQCAPCMQRTEELKSGGNHD
jgi:hypothetical protein